MCAHHHPDMWVVVPELGYTLTHEDPSPVGRSTSGEESMLLVLIQSVLQPSSYHAAGTSVPRTTCPRREGRFLLQSRSVAVCASRQGGGPGPVGTAWRDGWQREVSSRASSAQGQQGNSRVLLKMAGDQYKLRVVGAAEVVAVCCKGETILAGARMKDLVVYKASTLLTR